MPEGCEVCRDCDEPCAKCRKEIHQGWHRNGMWWIRIEECDESCPGWADTLRRRVEAANPTPRERAQLKQLKREGLI